MPRKGVLVESVLPILSAMGSGISYDTILFTKLIRICVAYLESHNLSVTTGVPEVLLNDKENTPPPGSSGSGRSTSSTLTRNSSPVEETKAEVLGRLTANELAFYNQFR